MHALVLGGAILKTHDFAGGDVPELAPNKGVWLSIVEADPPAFDPASEQLVPGLSIAEGVPTRTWTKAPVGVPQVVTPRQARQALLSAGLLDDVEAAIAAAPRAVQLDWEYAIEIRRDNATIATMAVALGLTSGDLDDLFRQAAAL